MKNIKLILIILFFLIGISYAQSLEVQESELNKVIAELNFNRIKVDSLKNELKKLSAVIERSGKEEDYQNAAKISKLISNLENNRNKLLKEESEKRNTIVKIYRGKIDSLKLIEDKSNFDNLKLIEYSAKLIVFEPTISQLNFSPIYLLEFSEKKKLNKNKSKIIEEYIENAVSELDKNINQINKLIDEVENLSLLANKTSEFMDEAAVNNQLIGAGLINKEGELNVRENSDGIVTDGDYSQGRGALNSLGQNIQVMNNTYELVSKGAFPEMIEEFQNIPNLSDFSFEEYKNYLVAVKNILVRYKNKLQDNLDLSND